MKPKNIGKSIFLGLALLQAPAVLAVTGTIYVAAESTSNVVVVDAATNSIITNVGTGVGTAPHNPVVSPDNQYVWVTLKTTQQVAKIDVQTNTLVATYDTGGFAPVHMDFSADGNWLYIVNQTSDQIAKMSTADGSIMGTYTFGGAPSLSYMPHDINVSPDGSQLWITDETANTVSILDTNLGTVTNTINVGARPIQVVFSIDGTQAFTTNFNDNTVSVIDVPSLSLLDTFSMGGAGSMGPMGIVADPDGTGLWMSGTTGNTVHRHSLLPGDNYSYTEINDLIAAHGLDISDDGSFLYTSVYYDGSSTSRDAIAVIDADTGLVVDKFYTPGAEDLHGVAFVSAVPVPAAIWLFGSGLFGLMGVARRSKL